MSSRLRNALSHSISTLFGVSATLGALYTKGEYESNRRQKNDESNDSDKVSKQLLQSEQLLLSRDGKPTSQEVNNETDHTLMAMKPASSGNKATFPYIESPLSAFQPNPNLRIVFDTRTKNPMYVMERLSILNFNNSKGKASPRYRRDHYRKNQENQEKERPINNRFNFHETKSLSPHHRSRNNYYRNSGYDRGHLAPAANYNYNSNHKLDTYTLTNISPQHPVFNRKIWSKVEEWVRQLVKKINDDDGNQCEEVYVITGPVWLPSKQLHYKSGKNMKGSKRNVYEYSFHGIGSPPSLVHVPTHFFKLVFTMKKKVGSNNISSTDHDNGQNVVNSNLSLESVDQFAAFVIPNYESTDDNADEEVKLSDFIVRIGDIEAVTGISFFPSSSLSSSSYHHGTTALTNNGSNDIDIKTKVATLEVFDLLTELCWCLNDHHVAGAANIKSSLPDSTMNENTISIYYEDQHQNKKKKCQQIKRKILDIIQNYSLQHGTKETIMQNLPNHICTDQGGGCGQILIRQKKE